MRDKIVSAIMELVKPPPVRTKPTLEELERILNSDDPPPFVIEPDGTMLSTPQSGTTVGAVADAVMRLLDTDLSRAPADKRTPHDFAIEFGEYLAKSAETYLNEAAIFIRDDLDTSECDTLRDVNRGLKSAIYEFRKRVPASRAPADGWRDIASAPKGRKIIGGYFNEFGRWRSVMACYYKAKTLEADSEMPDDFADEDGYAPEGWYEESETRDTILPIPKLTHWHECPSPPGTAASRAPALAERKRIYLASSWRNLEQPEAVAALRAAGHDVYDFRNPPDGIPNGFRWSEIDPAWEAWSAAKYREKLKSPLAQQGFNSDFTGMKWADVGILLLPCGRSAHLEIGWMAGAGKKTIVWTRDGQEPELMALLASQICVSLDEVHAALSSTPAPKDKP